MVNGGSRCVARLNGLVAVVTAVIVVVGFVGAAPPGRDPAVAISAARVAAVKTSMSAQWAPLDQVVATHADLMAAAAHVVVGGGSNLGAAAAMTPKVGSGTAPTPLAATSTSLPTPQPAGAVAVIEQAIVSALSTAFLTLAQPLVSTPELAAVFGPFVFLGIILYGLVVGVPLTIFNSIAAPILNLLPFAAVPAPVSAKTVAPTAAVPDPTAAPPDPTAAGKGQPRPTGANVDADVVKAPSVAPRGFMQRRLKPALVVPTAATTDFAAAEADNGKPQGRPAPDQLNTPGVRGNSGGAKAGAGKSDAGKSDTATSDTGKSLSRNKKSGPSGKSGGGQSGDAGRPGAAGQSGDAGRPGAAGQSGDSGQSGNGNKGGS